MECYNYIYQSLDNLLLPTLGYTKRLLWLPWRWSHRRNLGLTCRRRQHSRWSCCHPCMSQYGVESKMTGVFICAVCFHRCTILTAAWSKWGKSRTPNTKEHCWYRLVHRVTWQVSSDLRATVFSNIFWIASGMCCRIRVVNLEEFSFVRKCCYLW